VAVPLQAAQLVSLMLCKLIGNKVLHYKPADDVNVNQFTR